MKKSTKKNHELVLKIGSTSFSGAKRVCMATERSAEINLEKFLIEVLNLKSGEGSDVIY